MYCKIRAVNIPPPTPAPSIFIYCPFVNSDVTPTFSASPPAKKLLDEVTVVLPAVILIVPVAALFAPTIRIVLVPSVVAKSVKRVPLLSTIVFVLAVKETSLLDFSLNFVPFNPIVAGV